MMNDHKLEIAIIDSNILSCLALKEILEDIIPTAAVRIFSSFEEFEDKTCDTYAHYFISSQIYFNNVNFFLPRKIRCVILTQGEKPATLQGLYTINTYQSEKALTKDILQLYKHGHQHQPPVQEDMTVPELLTKREIEVLILITRGYINKEIAEELHIGLTTVISHRKNIQEKLGIKSVPGLTIYAVMHGYINVNEI